MVAVSFRLLGSSVLFVACMLASTSAYSRPEWAYSGCEFSTSGVADNKQYAVAPTFKLPSARSFTVCFWAAPFTISSGTILSYPSFRIYQTTNGLQVTFGTSVSSMVRKTAVNVWDHHCVAYRYLSSTPSYYFRNGVLARNFTPNGGVRVVMPTTGALYIGQHSTVSAANAYRGVLDRIQFLNYDISEAVATKIRNGAVASTATMVAYYTFDDCSCTVLKDSSANAYNGTLYLQNTAVGCPADDPTKPEVMAERAALLALYASTGGAKWSASTFWGKRKHCGSYPTPPLRSPWYGLSCDADDRVTAINLAYNRLTGTIPPDFFTPFSKLQLVYLHSNSLNGTLPTSIGNLRNATLLALQDNLLVGTVPTQIGNAALLQKLYLDNNKFTSLPTDVGKLKVLRELTASGNLLTGSLSAAMIGTSLAQLNLASNKLSGSLPVGFLSSSALRFLYLQDNAFSGSLPNQPAANALLYKSVQLSGSSFTCRLPAFTNEGSLIYPFNVTGSKFFCPITKASSALLGVACVTVNITSLTPVLQNIATWTSSLTASVKGNNFDKACVTRCQFSGATDSADTLATVVSSTSLTCPLPKMAAGTVFLNLVSSALEAVSSSSLILRYQYVCPGGCTNSSRGICNTLTGNCTCYPQYTGLACQLPNCPNDSCGGNGVCLSTGVCACNANFRGDGCNIADIPCPTAKAGVECSGHGVCNKNTGQCVCNAGYWDLDCNKMMCPPYDKAPYCNGPVGGTCNTTTGVCKCLGLFQAPNCLVSLKQCAKYNGVECANATRGQCNRVTGECICYAGYWGSQCQLTNCPNNCTLGGVSHGKCDAVTGKCKCDANWNSTADCSVYRSGCPKDCYSGTGNGVCDVYSGKCICNKGYIGTDCSLRQCPGSPPCSGPANGICTNTTGVCVCSTYCSTYTGKSVCAPAFSGTACQIAARTCPADCSGRGTCDPRTGLCACRSPASGVDCADTVCANDCTTPNGVCNKTSGVCICGKNYTLDDCSALDLACPTDCNIGGLGGYCDRSKGVCVCNAGFVPNVPEAPSNCTLRTCTNNCNSASLGGVCNPMTGLCTCNLGWSGVACGVQNLDCAALRNCSQRGTCDPQTGRCVCAQGRAGDDCSAIKCDLDCGQADGQGTCNSATGLCVCNDPWKAPSCRSRPCPLNSLNGQQCGGLLFGTCDDATGVCACQTGYYGNACQYKFCSPSANCSGHGTCNNVTGTCTCETNWQLRDDCSIKYIECPRSCSKNGECVTETGLCVCDLQHTGVDCSQIFCVPPDCSGHGTCDLSKGLCKCAANYTGSACATPNFPCPNNCTDQGYCDPTTGLCSCDDGFRGDSCVSKICAGGCADGSCGDDGVCLCPPNWDVLPDCSKERPNLLAIILGAVGGAIGVIVLAAIGLAVARHLAIKKVKARAAAAGPPPAQ